jgi:signal recognition particle GTPase
MRTAQFDLDDSRAMQRVKKMGPLSQIIGISCPASARSTRSQLAAEELDDGSSNNIEATFTDDAR